MSNKYYTIPPVSEHSSVLQKIELIILFVAFCELSYLIPFVCMADTNQICVWGAILSAANGNRLFYGTLDGHSDNCVRRLYLRIKY